MNAEVKARTGLANEVRKKKIYDDVVSFAHRQGNAHFRDQLIKRLKQNISTRKFQTPTKIMADLGFPSKDVLVVAESPLDMSHLLEHSDAFQRKMNTLNISPDARIVMLAMNTHREALFSGEEDHTNVFANYLHFLSSELSIPEEELQDQAEHYWSMLSKIEQSMFAGQKMSQI